MSCPTCNHNLHAAGDCERCNCGESERVRSCARFSSGGLASLIGWANSETEVAPLERPKAKRHYVRQARAVA